MFASLVILEIAALYVFAIPRTVTPLRRLIWKLDDFYGTRRRNPVREWN